LRWGCLKRIGLLPATMPTGRLVSNTAANGHRQATVYLGGMGLLGVAGCFLALLGCFLAGGPVGVA
jgi:hypothetical protein